MSSYYLAYDTETGSLYPESGDLLTAYFAILDENMNILEDIDLKLKPNDGALPIAEAGALRVNGINIHEHMKDPNTIEYKQGKEKLLALINKYFKKVGKKSNIQPFGYNILGFDNAWVQKYLLPRKEWDALLHYKCVDVMCDVDFLKRCGWLPNEIGTLGSVNDYFGLPKLNAHEAKSDVLMTINISKKLIELMKSKKEGGSGSSQDLIALLESE